MISMAFNIIYTYDPKKGLGKHELTCGMQKK